MTVYVHVKMLLLFLQRKLECIVVDIYPEGDVHFIVIGIYRTVQKEEQTDVIPCFFQAE